jgi:hypothetical protein
LVLGAVCSPKFISSASAVPLTRQLSVHLGQAAHVSEAAPKVLHSAPYPRAMTVREKAGDRLTNPCRRRLSGHNALWETRWQRSRTASRFDRGNSQNCCNRPGLDATNIAGRRARAGMATQAALSGSSERSIAKTTRHRSRRVLRRYIRPGELFRENAAASLGLSADSLVP